MDQDARYRAARKRVAQLRGFYSHLSAYLAVNVGLTLLNAISDQDDWWVLRVILWWGFGLAIHGLAVLAWPVGFLGPDWEERKTREIVKRMEERERG